MCCDEWAPGSTTATQPGWQELPGYGHGVGAPWGCSHGHSQAVSPTGIALGMGFGGGQLLYSPPPKALWDLSQSRLDVLSSPPELIWQARATCLHCAVAQEPGCLPQQGAGSAVELLPHPQLLEESKCPERDATWPREQKEEGERWTDGCAPDLTVNSLRLGVHRRGASLGCMASIAVHPLCCSPEVREDAGGGGRLEHSLSQERLWGGSASSGAPIPAGDVGLMPAMAPRSLHQ